MTTEKWSLHCTLHQNTAIAESPTKANSRQVVGLGEANHLHGSPRGGARAGPEIQHGQGLEPRLPNLELLQHAENDGITRGQARRCVRQALLSVVLHLAHLAPAQTT